MVDATCGDTPGNGSTDDDWSDRTAAAAAGAEVQLTSPDGTPLVLVSADRWAALRSQSSRGELEPRLSRREREVLELAAAGRSAGSIADDLGLAVNTVAQHLVSVRRKLAVHSTREAVVLARSAGLID